MKKKTFYGEEETTCPKVVWEEKNEHFKCSKQKKYRNTKKYY